MTGNVNENQQGELQGVMTAVHALSMIVSPLMMAGVFAHYTREGASVYLPGAPFLVAMVLLLLGLIVFLRTRISVA